MLNRDDYRKIKSFSKDEMDRWLNYKHNMMYNKLRQELRREFNDAYTDELDNSIQNFLISIMYTLHYNEDLHLNPDELAGFMEDLFVTVDMFRKGEYKPEEYAEQLKADGISFTTYDYDYTKIYREKDGMYQKRNEETIKFIEDWIANNENSGCNLSDLQLIIDKLKGE